MFARFVMAVSAARRHLALILVLAVIAPLYLFWGYSDRLGILGSDATYYLMAAATYSPFSATDAVYSAAAHESRFPPLYPILLAALNAADHLDRAAIATVLCFLLALSVFYAWCRELGLPKAPATAAVLIFALLPGSYMLALYPQSEYLYVLLSLAALWLLERHERTQRRIDIFSAAVLIAAACLTRTVGVCLLVPLVLSVFRARRPSAFAALVVATAPLLLWHLLHATNAGYGVVVANIYTHATPQALWAQVASSWTTLRYGLAKDVIYFGGMFSATQVLAALMLAAAICRCMRLRVDGVYVLTYLAILLVWPFPEEAPRLVWVILPVALAQTMLLLLGGSDARSVRGYACMLLAGAIFVLTLPTAAIVAQRYRAAAASEIDHADRYVAWYDPDPAKAAIGVRTTQTIVDGLRQINQLAPAGACVISTKPDLVNYYAHRDSTLPPVDSDSQPEFERWLSETKCGYVAMMSATQSVYPTPMYPSRRLDRGETVDLREFSFGDLDYTTFELVKLR
jgi:hypothetical protein